MNVAEKSAIARREIRNLSEHHDENSAVRIEVLRDLQKFIDDEIAAIADRDADRLAELKSSAA